MDIDSLNTQIRLRLPLDDILDFPSNNKLVMETHVADYQDVKSVTLYGIIHLMSCPDQYKSTLTDFHKHCPAQII